MLKLLSIQNYALIDSLDISFNRGFSVITGETGAGKSIILGALSLILGQRAESRFIKQNEQKCSIEGVFDISQYDLFIILDSSSPKQITKISNLKFPKKLQTIIIDHHQSNEKALLA